MAVENTLLYNMILKIVLSLSINQILQSALSIINTLTRWIMLSTLRANYYEDFLNYLIYGWFNFLSRLIPSSSSQIHLELDIRDEM